MSFQPLNVNLQYRSIQAHSELMRHGHARTSMCESNDNPTAKTDAQLELSTIVADPFRQRACLNCIYLRRKSIFDCMPACANGPAYNFRKSKYPDATQCQYWAPHYWKLSPENRKKIVLNGFNEPSTLEKMQLLLLRR